MTESRCGLMRTRGLAAHPRRKGRRVCRNDPDIHALDQERARLITLAIRPSAGPQVHHSRIQQQSEPVVRDTTTYVLIKWQGRGGKHHAGHQSRRDRTREGV
jgi:hypothetical protein